jgi:hypothetical protein
MATTAEGRLRAARHLLRMTGLGEHVLVQPHLNADEAYTEWDWNGLQAEPFSKGERVALEVLRVCTLGHGFVRVDDLYQCDDHYRGVLLDALRMALLGDEVVLA